MRDLTLQLLLADFDGIVGVIIMIIAFLGWIMNFVSSKNKEAQKTMERHSSRPPAQRNESREDDVELFLDEVKQRQPRRQSRLKEQQDPAGQPFVPPRPATSSRSLTQKPEETVLELVEPELGGGVRQHLQQYMTPNRIEEGVRQHMASTQELGRGVQQSVAELLKSNLPPGKQTALLQAALALSDKTTNRARVLALLKNPETVKQAILINEILSPPKTRRPRR